MRYRPFYALGLTVSILVLSCLSLYAQSPEYKIGAEDVLEIRFWQDESLNTTVRVGQDGRITMDIIGSIEASGKTTEELQSEIIRQMSRLNKNISQAVVRVTQYNFNFLYLTGQVLSPGKRTYETIPGLWDVINEAGGITALGDLTRVTIIRGGEEAGKVEVVNVTKAVSEGNVDRLPRIRRQDTIEIPALPGGIPQAQIGEFTTEAKNQVYVLGAVTRPGPVQFEENADLLQILAAAGGPSPTADLKKVKIISRDGAYSQTYQINIEKYSKTGEPIRYVVRKEDTFIVPQRTTSFLNFGTIATIVGTASTAWLLIDRISNSGN
jgi:protein involved in polysaccharide export with SLBB domain